MHAIRNLVRMGFGTTAVRWSQLGFGRTWSTSTRQATPRNLFGFKDGTNNREAEDPAQLDQHVWAGPGEGWMGGGTYLVARRIRMHVEIWDRTSPATHFVPMQRALSREDVMMEYLEHSGSAVFACPPGLSAPGSYWGQALFT